MQAGAWKWTWKCFNFCHWILTVAPAINSSKINCEKCRQRPSPALVTCCGATSQAVSYLQMLGRIHIARLPCGGSGNIVHQQILCWRSSWDVPALQAALEQVVVAWLRNLWPAVWSGFSNLAPGWLRLDGASLSYIFVRFFEGSGGKWMHCLLIAAVGL